MAVPCVHVAYAFEVSLVSAMLDQQSNNLGLCCFSGYIQRRDADLVGQTGREPTVELKFHDAELADFASLVQGDINIAPPQGRTVL